MVAAIPAFAVVVGLLLLDADAPAGPLASVAMADRWRWRRVIIVAVVKDDDASFIAAPAALLEALQGGTLALHLNPEVFLARPFQGRLVVDLHVPVLRLHGGKPRLSIWLNEARSRREGAPAAIVYDDVGAASAPAERRLCCWLGLDTEQRRRAGGVGRRA